MVQVSQACRYAALCFFTIDSGKSRAAVRAQQKRLHRRSA